MRFPTQLLYAVGLAVASLGLVHSASASTPDCSGSYFVEGTGLVCSGDCPAETGPCDVVIWSHPQGTYSDYFCSCDGASPYGSTNGVFGCNLSVTHYPEGITGPGGLYYYVSTCTTAGCSNPCERDDGESSGNFTAICICP